MTKYHLDPAGNPGKCTARKRCPYGDLNMDHYPTEEIARRAYELEYSSLHLRLEDPLKEQLYLIGPRQLPNRAWISLRNSMIDDRFSAHELEIAEVALSEEVEKLEGILKATPKESWGVEEREAAGALELISLSLDEVRKKAEFLAWERRRLLEEENPEYFS